MSERLKKEVTNEELARMVAEGFAQTATKDDVRAVEKRLDKLEVGYVNVNARLGHVETQVDRMSDEIKDINNKMVSRDEFDDLTSRVKCTERKLNIKSGR